MQRGEKLVLLCHCVPRACHGCAVVDLVRAAVDRGRWEPSGQGERDIFEKWLRAKYLDG